VAELLPACNTVIFDEAHQLPETASLFFGESVSTAQLVELARDARLEGVAAAKDFLDLPDGARALEKAARDLRLAIPGENARFSAAQLPPAFYEALEQAADELGRFGKLLESQAERSEGLEHCWRRAQELRSPCSAGGRRRKPDWCAGPRCSARRCRSTPRRWSSPTFSGSRWRAIHAPGSSPRPRWRWSSDFSHYCAELGLDNGENPADTGCWGSPFDYPNQALLYAPQAMPDPNSFGYNEAVVEAAWPLIRASRGRAFVLCTSLRAMRRIHDC
jgi:ATP-dependent DNA helicase DinG